MIIIKSKVKKHQPIKKYEFSGEMKEVPNRNVILKRIRAVRNFTLPNGTIIKKGDLGGWIEKEDNLSHDGKCWVHDDSVVCGDATVSDNAQISGESLVAFHAKVFGDAAVLDGSWVFGDAIVFGNAQIFGGARLYNGAYVRSSNDYYRIWGLNRETTVTTFYNTRKKDGKYEVSVVCGGFGGTLEEFECIMGRNVYSLAMLSVVKTHFNLE